MTRIILSKLRTATAIAIVALSLAACERDIILLDDSGQVVGKLGITANFPSPAHLTLNGKEYTGLWNTTRIYEEDLAKSRRLMGERAYLFGLRNRQRPQAA